MSYVTSAKIIGIRMDNNSSSNNRTWSSKRNLKKKEKIIGPLSKILSITKIYQTQKTRIKKKMNSITCLSIIVNLAVPTPQNIYERLETMGIFFSLTSEDRVNEVLNIKITIFWHSGLLRQFLLSK